MHTEALMAQERGSTHESLLGANHRGGNKEPGLRRQSSTSCTKNAWNNSKKSTHSTKRLNNYSGESLSSLNKKERQTQKSLNAFAKSFNAREPCKSRILRGRQRDGDNTPPLSLKWLNAQLQKEKMI